MFTTKNTLSTVIMVSYQKKILYKMNDMLYYGFTLTTVSNTLCTVQNSLFSLDKNNSIHGKKTLYMDIHPT